MLDTMGWTHEAATSHEGWVRHVLADGRPDRGTVQAGVVTDFVDDDVLAGHRTSVHEPSGHAETVLPWAQVVAWQVVCDCGWTGGSVAAVDDPVDGTRYHPEAVEKGLYPQWAAHIAPHTTLHDLQQLVDQRHVLEDRIGDAVRAARRQGASWTQVGVVVGLTRQGAQQRWAQP